MEFAKPKLEIVSITNNTTGETKVFEKTPQKKIQELEEKIELFKISKKDFNIQVKDKPNSPGIRKLKMKVRLSSILMNRYEKQILEEKRKLEELTFSL